MNSKSGESLVVWVGFEVVLDSGKEVLFDFGWHEGSALGQQIFDEIVQVDLLQSFVSDQIYNDSCVKFF